MDSFVHLQIKLFHSIFMFSKPTWCCRWINRRLAMLSCLQNLIVHLVKNEAIPILFEFPEIHQ